MRLSSILYSFLALLFAVNFSTLGQDRGSSDKTDARLDVHLPDETAGLDKIVKNLISTFDHIDILALGENHWRKADSDLRIRLISNPEFTRKVHLIVVEFASTAEQSVLDRYVNGDNVPLSDLQQVWKNTKGGQGGVWESPVYAEFFAAVREVNRKLPPEKRIRVLAGDPPPEGGDRNDSAVSILKEQVLAKGGKALLIYGTGHLYRAGSGVGGITKTIQAAYPGRIFVVNMMGGPFPEFQKFESALKTSVRPVLVSLRSAPFRDFSAQEFLGGENKMLVNGEWVPAPVFQGFTLGEVADAWVYLGTKPEVNNHATPVQ
jgi:uncharacterized iron-regulated protein